MVILPGADYKKLSTPVSYLRNNNIKVLETEDLASGYPLIARKLVQPQKLFREHEKTHIIIEYNDGATVNELAKKYSCNRETISRLLMIHGIHVAYGIVAARGKEAEIIEMYEAGLSSLKVANEIGISQASVLRCLREQGIKIRSTGQRTNNGKI